LYLFFSRQHLRLFRCGTKDACELANGVAVSAMKKAFTQCNLASLSSQRFFAFSFTAAECLNDGPMFLRNMFAQSLLCSVLRVFFSCFLPIPHSCLLQTKLALQKQLTKSLTTGFLPSPLTPPTLCTVANPLALRHPLGTTTFIQTPFLGPALFRPAPGPLRPSHTPIIFSPY
ncbi:hypothetical protein GOODEAATRI_019381, partial [Goodea atripinnis]